MVPCRMWFSLGSAEFLRCSGRRACVCSSWATMQIVALYDIHANLPALDAVLNEVTGLQVDRIVIGGDVLPGPMPREALARLAELKCPVEFILGNGEVAVLDCLARKIPRVPEQYQTTLRWVAGEISADQARSMSAWPKTLRITMAGLG